MAPAARRRHNRDADRAQVPREYLIAADLVETLYRGLADNTVGRVIDTLLRNDVILLNELGFAPLDEIGTQLLFRFVAAAYERRSLGIASHWPFDQWGRFLPEQSTAVSLAESPAPSRVMSWSPTAIPTACAKRGPKEGTTLNKT